MIKGAFTFILAAIVFGLIGLFLNPLWVMVTKSDPLHWIAVLIGQCLGAGAIIKGGM